MTLYYTSSWRRVKKAVLGGKPTAPHAPVSATSQPLRTGGVFIHCLAYLCVHRCVKDCHLQNKTPHGTMTIKKSGNSHLSLPEGKKT